MQPVTPIMQPVTPIMQPVTPIMHVSSEFTNECPCEGVQNRQEGLQCPHIVGNISRLSSNAVLHVLRVLLIWSKAYWNRYSLRHGCLSSLRTLACYKYH